MVKAYNSQLSGCGFEPRRRILDGESKASLQITIKIKEIKVAKWGTPKKKFEKEISLKSKNLKEETYSRV